MLQEDLYIPKQGIMTAICRSNKDMNDMTIPHIVVGATYRVDYVIIAQSRSMVCLSEFPELVYGAGLFTFYIDNEEIHIIWDYRALKRIANDTLRETTLVICRDLSEERITQIKQKHNNLRIIIRSDILK